MENAVDALKLAFAVLVFVIALALTVSVVGQARATSDIILSLYDKTNYYEYIEETENNAKGKDRIVGFETILPTIYRYAKEQYAVTILDTKGTPIVRYDLYTENFMRDWDDILKKNQKGEPEAVSKYNEIQKRIETVDNFIKKDFEPEKTIWDSLLNSSLYKCSNATNSNIKSGAEWMANADTDTILRIKADLGTAPNNKFVKNGVTYIGKNLSNYKDRTFKEKFLEIQTSGTTMTEQSEDNIEYSLETVKGNKKLEIIYILQKE